MKRTIIISTLLILTACGANQISKQFMDDSAYANFGNEGIINDTSYWKRAQPSSGKVEVVIINDMRAPKPISTCATILLGIDSNAQVKEVVLSHSYGNSQTIRNQIKLLRSSQWVPTTSNPSRQPAVVKTKFTYVPDEPRNKAEFEKECADYPELKVRSS